MVARPPTGTRRGVDAERGALVALGVVWLALPFVAGPALAAALDDAAAAVRAVASVGLWVGWAAVLPALLVPRPAGLTLVRVVAPASAVAALAAAVDGAPAPLAWAAALAATVAAAALALLPEVGAVFVNGAAYGDERRHLLRAPGALLVGPIPLAWALLVAGVAAGPLLLAAGRWVLGGVALAVGLPLAALLARALHRLTQRWVVMVPAGLVLHDPWALVDPVLFRRGAIAALRPAPADTDALDLTQRAPGLALQLDLTEAVPLVLAEPRGGASPGRSVRLLFTPTRPGRVLADARARRIRVG